MIAQRRVGQIKEFYVHAIVYVLVNTLLVTINLLTSRVRIPRDGEQSFHGIVNTDSTAT